MFNLILYMLTINCILAVPMELQPDVVGEDLIQEQEDMVAEDCSWFSVHFTDKVHNIHIPDHCALYDFVHDLPECDSKTFPMTCKFKLTKVNNSTLKNLLSLQPARAASQVKKRRIKRPNPRNEQEMEEWATTAVGKAILYVGKSCKPATVGKAPPRHMDCDACWAWWVPYPCNCNCRGWNQVLNLCSQPCHERLPYSFDSGAYCHKACDRDGQYLTVGCGLGHDRVCVGSSGDCVKRWVSRTVDVISLLANLIPGAGPSMKAASTAAKASAHLGRRAAIAAAAASLRASARKAVSKLKNWSSFKNAFKHFSSGVKDRVLEEAAIRFMTANMPSQDNQLKAIDIAAVVDPTGVVSLVKGWLPPDSCDSGPYCTIDYCEALS